MKRFNMAIIPAMSGLTMNPFRDVRGEALTHRTFLGMLTSLLLIFVMLGGACRKQPAALEIKGRILAMMTATGFDDKGQLQNSSFAFAPTAPQLVVIVHVGNLDSGEQASGANLIQLEPVAAAAPESVVNIAWYRVSMRDQVNHLWLGPAGSCRWTSLPLTNLGTRWIAATPALGVG
ncbi:MAG: hypothetical protein ND866_16190 [Pyrinomonadaceae bacterium]|nr:hypothetical protein [Pyrinomonadaceae bacterium]